MKKDKEIVKAKELLQSLNFNRPMSKLHPRYQIFLEAFDELVSEGEIGKEEAIYFAFCYAEQNSRKS